MSEQNEERVRFLSPWGQDSESAVTTRSRFAENGAMPVSLIASCDKGGRHARDH